jgi:hypothetical protein
MSGVAGVSAGWLAVAATAIYRTNRNNHQSGQWLRPGVKWRNQPYQLGVSSLMAEEISNKLATPSAS